MAKLSFEIGAATHFYLGDLPNEGPHAARILSTVDSARIPITTSGEGGDSLIYITAVCLLRDN